MLRTPLEEVVIFQGIFDPHAKQLQRIIHCLVKAGRTGYMLISPSGITMAQKPTAGSSAKNLTSWSHFQFPLLGLRDVIVRENTRIALEMQLSILWNLLQAISSHSLALLQLLSSGVLRLRSKANCGSSSDLTSSKEGVTLHELPIVMLQSSELDILSEPTVSRPVLSFHLPTPNVLRSKFLTLTTPRLQVSVNPQGTLIFQADDALIKTMLKFSGVRIVNSLCEDRLRLVGVTVDRTLLAKALTHAFVFPAGLFSTVCAVIPNEALIISVSLLDSSPAGITTQQNGNIMTFYIHACA